MKSIPSSEIPKQIGISLVDQGALSAFNFLLAIFLIRNVGKSDYGLFVVATSIIYLLVGFQNALITTQLTVIGAKKTHDAQRIFSSALSIGQFIYWLPTTIIAVFFLYLLYSIEAVGVGYYRILIVCALSSLGILTREFIRSYYFFRMNSLAVLLTDGAYLILVSILCVAGFCNPRFGQQFHLFALASLGIASLLVAANGFFRLNRGIELTLAKIRLALTECWANGRWAALGVLVTWAQSQSYVYLISPLLGVDHMAVAHSGRLLLMPIALLNMSYGWIIRAKWAHDWNRGERKSVFRDARLVLLSIVTIILFYSVLLYLFRTEVVGILFGEEYKEAVGYIVLWALFFVCQAVRNNASLLLQVFEKFRFLTIANTLTAIVTVVIGIYLIQNMGAKGSLLAMISGEILLAVILSLRVKKAEIGGK